MPTLSFSRVISGCRLMRLAWRLWGVENRAAKLMAAYVQSMLTAKSEMKLKSQRPFDSIRPWCLNGEAARPVNRGGTELVVELVVELVAGVVVIPAVVLVVETVLLLGVVLVVEGEGVVVVL
jgi:hypothetical protein